MIDRTHASVDPILEAAGGWCLKLAAGALTTEEQRQFEVWVQADPEHRRALLHAEAHGTEELCLIFGKEK